MASNYSQKTAISLFKFDTEDKYREWLGKNQNPTDYQDNIAIVKNEKMNNGLDLFINGHSLTKTRIYVQREKDVIEVTQENYQEIFKADRHYTIVEISRRGLGQKNIVLLKEVNFVKMVDDKVDSRLDEFLTDGGSLQNYLDNYLDEYFENHPVQSETADAKKIENILTNTHYMFRKIFSLLYLERDSHLGLTVRYYDKNGEVVEPFQDYKKMVEIDSLDFKVFGCYGKSFEFKSLKFYKDDIEEPIFTIDGSKIVAGQNPKQNVDFGQITETTQIHAVLEYTMTKLVNVPEINSPANYDSSVGFKSKNESTCYCCKFFIIEPKLEISATKLNFSDAASTQKILIKTNSDWVILNDSSWVDIDKTSGSEGEYEISISVLNNVAKENRNVTLEFRVNMGETKYLEVEQSKIGANVSVTPTSLTFGKEGGTQTLVVTSNYAWAANDNSTWIELNQNGDVLEVVVSENPNTSLRNGKITITSDGVERTVSVSQQAQTVQKTYDNCYLIILPQEKMTSIESVVNNSNRLSALFAEVNDPTSGTVSHSYEVEYGKPSEYEFAYTIPTAKDGYQVYVAVPTRDVDVTVRGNVAIVMEFADNVNQIIGTENYSDLEYVILKQDAVQEPGISSILKIKTK